MVRGLDMFRTWFGKFPDQYVLIGGTAASLVMNDAGVDFRQTKDLDVVLHVEALSSEFVATFWEFVRAGGGMRYVRPRTQANLVCSVS